MSGDDKPGPASFTQREIDALVDGRRPAAITRRLKAVRTPALRRRGRGDASKPSPPALKRAELLALRKGRPSQPVRKRLFVESAAGDASPATETGKPAPSQQPPAKRATKY
jgi:hypothetical protein